jgi:hypothetical protein
VCSMHGAAASQVAAAARTRVVEAEAARQLRVEGYESTTINPVEELLKLGAEVVAFKDLLRARLAELSDPEWVTRSKLAVEDVAPLVRAYERAQDRCERTLTNMLRLDLEARQVRIAEREAAVIVSVIEAALVELGIGPGDARVRSVVGEQLRRAAEAA